MFELYYKGYTLEVEVDYYYSQHTGSCSEPPQDEGVEYTILSESHECSYEMPFEDYLHSCPLRVWEFHDLVMTAYRG